MRNFLSLIVIVSAVFANIAVGSEPFSILTCRSFLEQPLVARTTPSKLLLTMAGQSFSSPLHQCSFSGKQPGEFSCLSRTGEGTQSISGDFSTLNGYDYFHVVVETSDIAPVMSTRYLVERHNFEGTPQPSECMIDNEYLYLR